MIFPNPFPPVGFIQYGLKTIVLTQSAVHGRWLKRKWLEVIAEQELTIVVKGSDGGTVFFVIDVVAYQRSLARIQLFRNSRTCKQVVSKPVIFISYCESHVFILHTNYSFYNLFPLLHSLTYYLYIIV